MKRSVMGCVLAGLGLVLAAGSSSDAQDLQQKVAAAKQALVVAEGEARLSHDRLRRLVGLDELGTLTAPGPIPIPAGDEPELLGRAYDQRLEMKTLLNQFEAAGLLVKVEKGAWYPELEAVGQYFQQKAGFPANNSGA